MQKRWLTYAMVIVLVLVAGCTTSSTPSSPQSTTQSPGPAAPATNTPGSSTMTVHVGSLNPGDPLPAMYTCAGSSSVTPPVSWENVPPGTQSLVLILDDPDSSLTQWLLYNIPPAPGNLAANQPDEKVLSNGAQQGESSTGLRGYYPPCPPIGTQNRYIFRLYAVDMVIAEPTAERDAIDSALTGHTLAEADFVTTFKR